MEKITVKQYIENPELLEMYYTPYQQKCKIVTEIIDQLRLDNTDLWFIDYAQLKPMKDSIFVSSITNIDMISKDEEDLLPYDSLCKHRKWNDLIMSIKDEYDSFNEVFDLNMKLIKDYNSTARVIDEISSTFSIFLGDISKSINTENLSSFMNIIKNGDENGD